MRASLRVTVLAAVLLVTQQACGSPGTDPPTAAGSSAAASGGLGNAPSTAPATPAQSPSATRTPASTGGKSTFPGDRQFYFFVLDKGEEVPESLLAATSGGTVEVNADFSSRALFVPVPNSPGSKDYLIKTGKLRKGGEALCLQVRSGSSPLTLVTAACDGADRSQLFAFDNKGKDNQGRTTYAIRNQDAFLQWDPNGTSGLIAEELGAAKLDTTWVAIDRGKSTVPRLGG